MLEVSLDLVPSAEVEEEGERVNVESSSDEYGTKSPYDENRAENVILESEQSQTHVGEDEILSQEVKDLKELFGAFC